MDTNQDMPFPAITRLEDAPESERRLMIGLATTDELRANLEHQRLVNAKHNRPASWLESFEKRVLRGELRDALAPLLVAGCWCFSTGEFRGPKDARIAGGRDYCPCEIGQAAKAAWLKEREMERAREWNAGVQQKVKAAGIPRRSEDCTLDSSPLNQTHPDRSEERRVGKECR